MNVVVLCGFVAKDSRLSSYGTATEGALRADFVLGVPRSYDRDRVDWVRVVCWRQRAKWAGQWAKKGVRLCVRGALRFDQYTDKDGASHTMCYVEAESIEFAERAPKRDEPETFQADGGFLGDYEPVDFPSTQGDFPL